MRVVEVDREREVEDSAFVDTWYRPFQPLHKEHCWRHPMLFRVPCSTTTTPRGPTFVGRDGEVEVEHVAGVGKVGGHGIG